MNDIDERRRLKSWEKPLKLPEQKGPPFKDEPLDPGKVSEIIRLRDEENLSWREIGKRFGLSAQAPFLLYQRWKNGVIRRTNKKVPLVPEQ